MSTTEIIKAAQGGDKAAMEQLLLEQQPLLYRFGLRLCRDAEDASEILQETLLTLARSLPEFRGESSLSTWLYRVAHSHCLKRRRKSKFAPTHEESLDDPGQEWEPAATTRSPEEEVAGRQLESLLEEAIGALAPAYREVLVLRDVEGLSAQEVAEVLQLSVEAVKSRLHRARLALRQRLAPVLEEAPLPDCPDILRLFSAHQEGDVSPAFCAQMEAHLARCSACRGRCDSLKQVLSRCHAMPTPEVPEAIQTEVRAAIRQFLGRV